MAAWGPKACGARTYLADVKEQHEHVRAKIEATLHQEKKEKT